MINTIADVSENDLCCGCGVCAAVCPNNAITMEIVRGFFSPKIEKNKCNNCQLCIKCCPGYSVDFEVLSSDSSNGCCQNSQVGTFLECYVGHSKDSNVRYNSASGGLVTQLLISALEDNIIDGALVTRMKEDNPLLSETFIARTKEEIIEASKSKYCPVAINAGLKQILKEKGKYAVVGLPCHIHGIKKAEKHIKSLENKIILHIGLLCSHMVTFSGTELLLEKKQIEKNLVKKLSYRGKGWPGSMTIKTQEGKEYDIPLFGSWNAYWPIFSSFLFTPIRCTMCPDQAAELADVSLGDAWLPEMKNEKIGKSVIICRTKIGNKILAIGKSNQKIDKQTISVEKVVQSQIANLIFKKKDLATRKVLFRLFGKMFPKFNPQTSSTKSFGSLLRAFFIFFGIWASSNKYLRPIIVNAPFSLFRLYYGIYKFGLLL